MEPLRVGMLLDGATERYGLRAAIAHLLESLDRDRVEVTGLFLTDGAAAESLAPLCHEAVRLEIGGLPRTRDVRGSRRGLVGAVRLAAHVAAGARRLVPQIQARRLQVIHAHYWNTFLIGGLAARWSGARSIWHLHGGFEYSGRGRWLWDELADRLTDRVFCISRWVRSTIPPAWKQRAAVLYNGLPLAAMASAARPGAFRARFNVARERRLVGAFGMIIDRKGFEFFVEAALAILSRHADVVFALVGAAEPDAASESLAAGLRRRVADAGVGDRFIFAGRVEAAADQMGDFDVIAMPTVPLPGDPVADFGEGFGLVAAEAMAAGVVVVATRCGAAPELVIDGESGLLVPPRDAAALAGAIGRLLDDGALRRRLAAAGNQRVRDCFDANRIGRTAEDLYDDLTHPG